ncbi:MAG TPA: hypothetical protein VGF59_19630 [Bryobacteraceae bacterium]|jgi:hypothetical protein
MKTGTVSLLLLIASGAPLAGQDYYPRHNFTIGGGVARPRGDLGVSLDDAPGFAIGYGYRFQRYLQADIGFDSVFGAASVHDFLNTGLGPLKITDREYFLPFGGRAIAPFARGRFLLSGGAGGVWMKYHERLSQPGEDLHIDCPECMARSGWGWYALANASGFLDSGRHFRVGVTARMIRGNTEGEPLGGVPPFQTKDHWLTLGGEFGFSF